MITFCIFYTSHESFMCSLPYSRLRFYDKILGSSKYKHKYCIGQLGTIYVYTYSNVYGCVNISPNAHWIRRADSIQGGEKFKWFKFVFYFSYPKGSPRNSWNKLLVRGNSESFPSAFSPRFCMCNTKHRYHSINNIIFHVTSPLWQEVSPKGQNSPLSSCHVPRKPKSPRAYGIAFKMLVELFFVVVLVVSVSLFYMFIIEST